MGEEFYAAIKLVTGEEIFSLISVDENDGDPIIILQNPVVMKPTQGPGGGSRPDRGGHRRRGGRAHR